VRGLDPKENLLLQIRGAGLPPPRFEEPFKGLSGKRKWAFDYYWDLSPSPLAVEYQGGTDQNLPSHGTRKNRLRDQQKLSEATAMGIRVLQVNRVTVESGEALDWIERCIWGGER
jgi:hypothetical protein